jgi:hypothetical protein
VVGTVFFPGYSFQGLRRAGVGRRGSLGRRRAIARGRLVDTQIARCRPHAAAPCTWATPETSALFTLLNTRFATWGCQYTVASEEWCLATRIDVLGVDRDGVYTAVEVKCGCRYRHCASAHGKMLGHPRVSDAPLHQHMLQAQLGAMLFGATHGVRCDHLLLYLDPGGRVSEYTSESLPLFRTEFIGDVLATSARRRTPRGYRGLQSVHRASSSRWSRVGPPAASPTPQAAT